MEQTTLIFVSLFCNEKVIGTNEEKNNSQINKICVTVTMNIIKAHYFQFAQYIPLQKI